MKKLFLISILVLTLAVALSACGADEQSFEDSIDQRAEDIGDSFEDSTRGSIFDDVGGDIEDVLNSSSEDEVDKKAEDIGDKWDQKGEDIEDKYDSGNTGDADADVDVDVDIDSDPGAGVPVGAAADDTSHGICNAVAELENSVDNLLSPDLTTPEAYAAAFDIAQEDYWKLREIAHGQYKTEFDNISKAAAGFETLLTHASDVVQRSNIVVQAGRIAYAVNALEQQVNCSCTP